MAASRRSGWKPRRSQAPGQESGDGSDSFDTYLEYNRVLRTWFVAFGVGGPALFLVNSALAQRLAIEGQLRLVVGLFLAGAGAQVAGALLNKCANWYVYLSILDEEKTWPRLYRFFIWLAEQFWIDVILDLITISCFGYAAWVLLTVFANG